MQPHTVRITALGVTMPKCSECGFLAIADKQWQPVPAPVIFRESGECPRDFLPVPMCTMLAYDLKKEQGGSVAFQTSKEIVGKERECGKFTPWIPALGPKEHAQMVFEKEIREMQAAQVERSAAIAREAAERSLREQREWQRTESDRLSRRNFVQNIWMSIITAIVGGVALYLGFAK